jgi:hypothetical protein
MYVMTYSLFKSGCLNTNIKLMIYKALVRSVIIYACPAWEYMADAHLSKLHHLQNRILHVTGYIHRCTPVRELHMAFKIPYMYDYITELSRTQAEVTM